MSVLDALDRKLVEVSMHHSAAQAEMESHEGICAANLKEVQDRQREGKTGPTRKQGSFTIGFGDGMDIDEPPLDSNVKIRNRK